MSYLKKKLAVDFSFAKAPIVLLLFLSPLLYVHSLQDPSTLPRYAMLSAFVGVFFFLLLFYTFRKLLTLHYSPIFLVVTAYLVLACLSSLWAVEPSNNLVYIIQLVLLVGLCFIVFQTASTTAIQLYLNISLYGASISALIGMAQNYGVNIFELRGPHMGGTFGYKNHMALYLDLIVPVGFFLILTSQNRFVKIASCLAFSICLIYIISSHTRGSHVALAGTVFLLFLSIIIFPVFRKNMFLYVSKNKTVLLLSALSVIVVVLIPGKTDEVLNRPAYEGDKIDTSTRDRLTAYSNSLSLIKENPILGTGYGTFWKAFRPYNNHPDVMLRSDENLVMYRLHSDPLQIIVELGFVGFALFATIFIWTFVIGIKLIIRNIEPIEQLLIAAMLLGLSTSLIHSLVDFPFLKPSSSIQIWLYVGLINGLYARQQKKYIAISSKFIKSIVLFFSVVFTIAAYFYFRASLMGSYYLKLAEDSFNNKQCNKSIEYIDKAVSTFSHDFFSHKMRVNLHLNCTKNEARLFQVLSEELLWDDTNTMALKWRGYLYIKVNRLNEAFNDFQKLSFLLPHKPSGPLGELRVLLVAGKINQAEKYVKLLKEKFPQNTELLKIESKLTEVKTSN